MIEYKKSTGYNSRFKKLAVQWLQEVEFSIETFVVADSLVLRNRQLLKPANRYAQCHQQTYQLQQTINNQPKICTFDTH